MLAAHLTHENHHDVLLRASHKTKRQIEELVAERSKPDVPSRVVALPQRSLGIEGMRAPTGSTSSGQNPTDDEVEQSSTLALVSAPTSVLSPRPALVMPLSPRRYKVEITVSEETRNKLAQLQDLLAHQATGRYLTV